MSICKLNRKIGEIIKVDSGANAVKFIKAPNKTMIAYMPMLKAYAESYVIEEDRDYFLARLETHAHCSKPFDINKLMEVLTSLLDLEYTENENVQ